MSLNKSGPKIANIFYAWLSLNKMVPNTKNMKYLVIGAVQKLLHSGNLSRDLSLFGTRIEETKDGKLLGVKIDKHVTLDNGSSSSSSSSLFKLG